MKYFLLSFFFAAALLVNAQTYTAGQTVQIEWEGKWYPGKIVDAKNGKYFISYDGYKDSYNEWVDAARLRKGSAASTVNASASSTAQAGLLAVFKARETVWRVIKSADGSKIYAGSATGKVYVLKTDDLSKISVIDHGKFPVYGLAENADGTLLAVGGYDGLKIYNTSDYSLKTQVSGFANVSALAFAGNRLIVSAADDKDLTKTRLVVWEVDQNQLHKDLYTGSIDYLVSDLAVDPSGKMVYTAVNNAQKGISCFEIETGKKLWHQKHTADVVCVKLNADGSKLVSGGTDKKVTLWDLNTRKALWSGVWSNGTSGYVYDAGFAQNDSKVVVTGVATGYVAKVFNAATGKEEKRISGTNNNINSMVCAGTVFFVAQTVNSYITDVNVIEKYSVE